MFVKQVMTLQEVTQVRIHVFCSQFVQVQQSLFHILLQLQGALHGLQPTAPLITIRHLNILQEDASSSFALEGQQLLGMLPLLMAVLLEEMGKTWKR
ncbi:hypothetical protein LDENG_00276570, partial [Lucifuga dentata]